MVMKKKKHFVLSKTETEQFEQVKLLLDSESYFYKNLQALSHSSGINVTKLKAGFKQLYGVSIYHYSLQIRIEKAKQLLSEKDLSVKAVALDCGFGNCQHFITTFKKWTGITPGRYKASIT
jgi:AraC family transcriptional regulator, transcriptional activator of the genes for pyochelin and ferripyochelin receptors